MRSTTDDVARFVTAKRCTGTFAIAALCALPMASASAASVNVSRDGMSSHMSFTWQDSADWNGGTLSVTDTKADGDAVHTNIGDQASFEGASKSNTAGKGHTATYGHLHYSSYNYNLQYLYLQGCVIRIFADACTSGGKTYNPYA